MKSTLTVNGVKIVYEGSIQKLQANSHGIFINGKKYEPSEETASQIEAAAAKPYVYHIQVEGSLLEGNVTCNGNVQVSGDVHKNVTANGDVHIGNNVGGSVDTGGGARVAGFVKGDVQAGGSIQIDSFVEGDVEAGGSVTVKGDIKGDVDAGGSISAKSISRISR